MNTEKVRYYNPSDEKELLRLYSTEISEDFLLKRFEVFKWITHSNPKAANENNGFVVEQDKGIKGYWGRMPINIFIQGKRCDAFFSHEALVESSMRGQGLAKKLIEKLESETPSLMLSLWHNHSIFSIKVKRHWKPLYFRPYLLVIDWKRMMRGRLRARPFDVLILVGVFLWMGLRKQKRCDLGRKEIHIRTVEQFGEEFDQFFNSIAHKFPVIAERSKRILNWKYCRFPHVKYHRVKAERKGEICGYIILRVDQRRNIIRGMIVDVLVDPEDLQTFQLLLSHSIDFFRDQKVDFIEGLFTYSKFGLCARNYGFFPGRLKEENSLLLRDPQDVLANPLKRSLDSWHITFGDSDREMWAGTRE